MQMTHLSDCVGVHYAGNVLTDDNKNAYIAY